MHEQELLAERRPLLVKVRACIGASVAAGCIPLWECLVLLGMQQRTAAGRAGTGWLLLQLVCATATTMDEVIVEQRWSPDPARDGFAPVAGGRADESRHLVAAVGLGAAAGDAESALKRVRTGFLRQGHRAACRYFLASRRHFGESVHISVAVDCAHGGDRSALCGLLLGGAADDLRAAWLPPQVRGGSGWR